MRFSQQVLLVFLYQLRQSVDLGRAEPTAVLQADWVEPELRLFCLTCDVHMRRFAPVSREEEHSVWTIAEDRRHWAIVYPDGSPCSRPDAAG